MTYLFEQCGAVIAIEENFPKHCNQKYRHCKKNYGEWFHLKLYFEQSYSTIYFC
jgi:hypothetical protein